MTLKRPSSPQVLELAQLLGDHGLRALDDLRQRPVEGALLHDVKPAACLHLGTVEADDANPRAGDELGGVLGKEQHTGVGEVAIPQHTPAAQNLLVGGVRPQLLLVAGHDLRIDIIDRGASVHLVLEPPLVLVVLQRRDLVVPELDAPIALAEEHRAVAAPSYDVVGGGPDVEDEDDIVPAMGVGDGEPDGLHHRDWLAAGKRHLLEVLDSMRAVASEPRDLAAVLDADDQLPTRSIRERHDVPRRVARPDPCALAIEVLALLRLGEELRVVLAYRFLHGASHVAL